MPCILLFINISFPALRRPLRRFFVDLHIRIMARHEKSAELKEKIAILPDTPGVYMYFDSEGRVIYVGKAKNLKRRVSSYFNQIGRAHV